MAGTTIDLINHLACLWLSERVKGGDNPTVTNFTFNLLSPPFLTLTNLPVMSGNSADSYSEGESDGEQVKDKAEVATPAPAPAPTPTLLYVRKGKNNGRVGRPKKLKNSQLPPAPPPPMNRRRGSGQFYIFSFFFFS